MPPDRHAAAGARARPILARLKKAYGANKTALNFSNPLECAVAVVLSAQSTDANVNEVTPKLFEKYRRPEDYLRVAEEELQQDIHSTGFFRQKTKALRGLSRKLLDDYDGEMPATIAELITLPGLGRKSANIVQGNCFPEQQKKDPDAGIAVDTHVGRVSVRLGLTKRGPKDAEKIERDLMQLIPKKEWPTLSNLFIDHGRQTCEARKPRCSDCPVEPLCPSSQEAGEVDLYKRAMATRKKK